MNWMGLAMELAREAMKSNSAPENPKPSEPSDLGTALAQQFTLIDHNMDAIVKTLNAQNAKLERAIRRQRFWNYALVGGIVIAVILGALSLRQ